jgi:multidrug efflux pump subunit AcrA (membrane-fusion protein)
MTLLIAVGFAATNIGDNISARAAIVSERTNITEVIERLRAERGRLPPFTPTTAQSVAAAQAALDAANLARSQECDRGTRTCRRRVVELAERRSEWMTALKHRALTDQAVALEAKMREAEASLKLLLPVAVADPQIEGAIQVIAWVSRGTVVPAPVDLKMVRILGLAAMPVLAGLLFAFAVALRQPLQAEPRGGEAL